jgi:hypothetical protein
MILEEENLENLNTSEEDSPEGEHPAEETETEGPPKEGTPEEEEHPSPKEEEEKAEKRYTDLQAKFTQQAQELAQLKQRFSQREEEVPRPSPEDIEKKEIAELGQIMEQYKDNPAQGLVSWVRKREQGTNFRMQAALSSVYAQLRYLGWRQKQLAEGITLDDLQKKEIKMREVLQKNPAIEQFPNALEQAEALVVGAKDINQVKKEILKAEEQKRKQREGHTVGASKSKAKGKKSVAQRASEFYGMKFAEPK